MAYLYYRSRRCIRKYTDDGWCWKSALPGHVGRGGAVPGFLEVLDPCHGRWAWVWYRLERHNELHRLCIRERRQVQDRTEDIAKLFAEVAHAGSVNLFDLAGYCPVSRSSRLLAAFRRVFSGGALHALQGCESSTAWCGAALRPTIPRGLFSLCSRCRSLPSTKGAAHDRRHRHLEQPFRAPAGSLG